MNTRPHYNGHTGKPKVGYSTEIEAWETALKLIKKYHHKMSVYKCPVCGKYHVGTAAYVAHQDRTLERIINWFKRVFIY